MGGGVVAATCSTLAPHCICREYGARGRTPGEGKDETARGGAGAARREGGREGGRGEGLGQGVLAVASVGRLWHNIGLGLHRGGSVRVPVHVSSRFL